MECAWLGRFTSLKPTAVPKPFRGLRVLLVDYDTTSLLYIASVLEEQFYKVRTTELASVAMSVLGEQSDQFDVVMADDSMPEMDTFEFLRQIRLVRDIPIILMSCELEMDMVWKAKREGVCFVLEKPVSAEDIKNIWQHVYRKRRCQMMENKNLDGEKEVDGETTSGGVSKVASGNNILKKNLPIAGEVNLVATEIDKPQGSKRKGREDEAGNERNSETSDLKQSYTKGLKTIEVEESDREEKDNGNSAKRSRFSWTPDLHCKFTEAIGVVGTKETRPKKVLEMMNVPNLTQRQVASHLQKYRDRIQRVSDTHETLLPLAPSTMTKSTSNFSGGNGPLQLEVQQNSVWSHGQSAGSSDDYTFESLDHLPEYAYLSSDLAKINPCSYRADHSRVQVANGGQHEAWRNGELHGLAQKGEFGTHLSTNRQGRQPLQMKESTEISVHLYQNQSHSKYGDVMKILEEEEELEDFNGEPSDVDRYCEGLGTHLLGSSSHQQQLELNSNKNSPQ